MRGVTRCAVVLVALVSAIGVAERGWAAAPLNGQIALTTGHDYPSTPPTDILLADPLSRRAPWVALRGRGVASGPVFSGDGRRLAYGESYPALEPADLVIAPVDRTAGALTLSDPVVLPDHERDPAFDPAGQHLVFTAGGASVGSIYSMNLVSREVKRLTEGVSARSPAYSPDGLRIVFVRTNAPDGGGHELAMMNSDGSGLRSLPVGAGAEWVDWSWHTGQLVFEAGQRLYVTDPEGATPVRAGPEGSMPRFSPDGAEIAYAEPSRGALSIWHLASDTVRNLGVRITSRPGWQPLTRPNTQPCDRVRLRGPRVLRVRQRWRRLRWTGLRDADGDRLRVEPGPTVPQPRTVQVTNLSDTLLGVRERAGTRLRRARRLRLPYTVFDERGERCEETLTLIVLPTRGR